MFLLNYMYTCTTHSLSHTHRKHFLTPEAISFSGVNLVLTNVMCAEKPPGHGSLHALVSHSILHSYPLPFSSSHPRPPFFLLSLHFFLILPPPSSFLCFPSSHLPSPSSLTECQATVHTGCVNKLDKICSEVSEGYMGRKGEGKIKLGLVRECRWE